MALESFYRRAKQERNRRQNAFGFHFDTEENRRFAEEVKMIQPLEAAMVSFLDDCLLKENWDVIEQSLKNEISMIPIENEITYFSDMERGQLLWYLFRKQAILRGEGNSSDLYVFQGYLLEVANLINEIQAESAFHSMIHIFQNGIELGMDKLLWEEYFLRLCASFVIANPQRIHQVQEYLLSVDLYWKWDLSACVFAGDFKHVDRFVKIHAKGLKDELDANKDFQKAAWDALPVVFTSLDQTFSRKDKEGKEFFSKIVTIEKESKTELDLLPVCRSRMGQKRRIFLSETASFDYKMNYGKQSKESWLLSQAEFCEGSREFFATIYRYTESFMRQYYGGPKRKRSVAKFLKKKYVRSGDHPRRILLMKKILQDSDFEVAIMQGVQKYLEENPVFKEPKQKESAKEKARKKIYAMDHEEIRRKEKVNLEEFYKVREESDHLKSLFHDGIIDYQK
ncbi:MAG: hypothetical protein Q4E53_03165 [Eubacteriales bacterium]|nr:hypothetical protein [Eubacteriales bacterium]